MDELTTILRKIRTRYRWIDGLAAAQRSLWLAAAFMLLLQIVGRLLPVENLYLWTLLPLALWLAVIPILTLTRRFPILRAAQRADIDLRLYERLSSALELSQSSDKPGYTFPPVLLQAQQADALQAARAVNPQRDLPFAWYRRPLITTAVLGALTLISFFFPNPMDAVLAERRAVALEAEKQAQHIEDLSQELAGENALTPEEREELARQLEQLAAQLRANPGDLEQALADLARMQQGLTERRNPNAAALQANLENLAQRLQNLAGIPSDPQQDAASTASQALGLLAEQLAQQFAEMDPEQRQQAAAELGALSAQAALAGDQGLAQALSSLAQALQANNASAIQSSSAQVQQALAQTSQALSAQQALQQAAQQLQQSQQALAQAAQTAAQANAYPGQNPRPNGSPGQTGSPGQNPGQGQNGAPGAQPGSSPGSGQAGSGGSQANTLPPATSSGQAGRPQGNRSGTTGQLGEQVYAPWIRPGSSGEELFIPGQDSNQGQTTSSEGSSPSAGAGDQALTPYYDVYYQYYNAANQAIQQGAVPASLTDYVREYFSQLEP